MYSISIRNILIVMAIVIILSRLDKVLAFISGIYQFFYDSLEPARRFSPSEKYLVLLGLFALVYITIFKLLLTRK